MITFWCAEVVWVCCLCLCRGWLSAPKVPVGLEGRNQSVILLGPLGAHCKSYLPCFSY